MLLVQVSDGNRDLSCIELSTLLREASGVSQVHEELSASYESHHKEDLWLGLEDVVHTD